MEQCEKSQITNELLVQLHRQWSFVMLANEVSNLFHHSRQWISSPLTYNTNRMQKNKSSI